MLFIVILLYYYLHLFTFQTPINFLNQFFNLQNAGVLTPALVPDFPYGKSGGGIPLKNAVCPTCGTGRILEVKYYTFLHFKRRFLYFYCKNIKTIYYLL